MASQRTRSGAGRPAGRVAAGVAVAVAGLCAASTAAAAAAPAAGHLPGSKGWRVIKTISKANSSETAIVGFRNGTVWSGGESATQSPVLYHLTGGHWHSLALSGPPGSFVQSLSATSPSNVWAAIDNEPDVAQLTSKGWVLDSLGIGTDDVLLAGVLTFSTRNTWAFSYDTNTHIAWANHFNGNGWHAKKLPSAVDANSDSGLVSASSSSNIWALTIKGSSYATMRYNGHKWQIFKLPAKIAPTGQTGYARQILALSPSNVWATVGTASKTKFGPIELMHWTGHRWSAITGARPKGGLSGPIASDGHGGLWLAGTTPAGKPRLFHYAGGRWTTESVPASPLGVVSINYLTLLPGTRAVLGVADINPSFGDNGAVILKYGV